MEISVFGVQYGNIKGVTAVITNLLSDDPMILNKFTFEWQRSSDNSSWTTIATKASNSYTDNTTISLPYYRCRYTDTSGTVSSWSSSVRVSKAQQIWINSSASPKKIMINIPSGSLKNVYYKV